MQPIDDAGVEPIHAWAGYNIGSGDELASPQTIREQIEDGEQSYSVSKVAASPLPGDARRCAYLQA